MTYFDINKFVSDEVLPQVNSTVQNYLEDAYSYIENEDDLEDLEYAEITDELIDNVKTDIDKLIKECSSDYDFSKVDNKELDNELIYNIIDSSFTDYKEMMLQRYQEEFEKQEYFDEYYSEMEF